MHLNRTFQFWATRTRLRAILNSGEPCSMRQRHYRSRCVVSLIVSALAALIPPFAVAASEGIGSSFEVREGKAATQVVLLQHGNAVLQSPVEGLWSIAVGWKDGWPAEWRHASPSSTQNEGEWTVLKGTIELESGTWKLTDSYRQRGDAVQCIRRFEWTGDKPLERCTLSVRFQAPGTGKGVVLPGILYHGNPSGERSGRTPAFHGDAGELAIFEEHRFPMPFASFEFPAGNGYFGAALHSLPAPVPYGNLRDQWWSLGVAAHPDLTEFVLLSGPTASNGQRSVVKAVQGGFLPYDNAYLNVEPGAIIEKAFYLQTFPVEAAGSGFQRAVKQSLALFGPADPDEFPSFEEIVRAKLRYARTRWLEVGADSTDSVGSGAGNGPFPAGFRKYYDRNLLVLGWCGQSAAPGYALQVLTDIGNQSESRRMVQKSLDFLSGAEFYEEGFHTWYDADQRKWFQPSGNPEILSQGQAMMNVANAIRVGKERSFDTSRWEAFLTRASDFHASRILADNWKPLSTNEAFFIAPLTRAYRLLGTDRWREAALKAGEVYAARHLSMTEPYWGGTLDASCEDKEAAWAALEGFLALYDMTGERHYLDWAQHAADVALTYLVVWDIDLPPGRLRNHGFKTRGWTAVSVQNQHIDVYGVLIAPSLYRLGQLSGRPELQDLAEMMFRSCGQLIDPYGSQGEQPQHTNYAQRGAVTSPEGLRGGYVEDWTVFWITAHFLNAAAQFKELGVDVGERVIFE